MSTTSVISPNAKIGKNVKIGEFNVIEEGVVIDDDVEIGNFCVLQSGVSIGKGTVLKHYVELRKGTLIGENCYVDSRVSSSGNCVIKNNVVLRYDSIIARGVEIGENTYVCPRVMTNNLDTEKEAIGGAKIGANCFIGTNAVLQHGIELEAETVIGSMAYVNKDCEKGTYVGIPAKKIEKK